MTRTGHVTGSATATSGVPHQAPLWQQLHIIAPLFRNETNALRSLQAIDLENVASVARFRDSDATWFVSGAMPPRRKFEAFIRYVYGSYLAEPEQVVDLALIEELREMYPFHSDTTVTSFLRVHPQLADVLLEARPRIEEHFDRGTPVQLEVVTDPENAGGDQLFAYIHTSLSVDEALARLDEFDEEWFLHQLPQVRDQLSFDLEFT